MLKNTTVTPPAVSLEPVTILSPVQCQAFSYEGVPEK